MTYKQAVIDSQKNLKIIKEKSYLLTKAKYGPSKPTKIPLNLNREIVFFVGAIIGDGHLRKDKSQITIELSNIKLINFIKKICSKQFERTFNILPVKLRVEGRKNTFHMPIDSKSIYNLLKEVFEIPSGKKSSIVKVPKYILNSNNKIKLAFLKGIMATEGGKRKRGYGLSTASKELWLGLEALFNNLKIPILVDKWVYKKYNKEYYGISFKKEYMEKMMWELGFEPR